MSSIDSSILLRGLSGVSQVVDIMSSSDEKKRTLRLDEGSVQQSVVEPREEDWSCTEGEVR